MTRLAQAVGAFHEAAGQHKSWAAVQALKADADAKHRHASSLPVNHPGRDAAYGAAAHAYTKMQQAWHDHAQAHGIQIGTSRTESRSSIACDEAIRARDMDAATDTAAEAAKTGRATTIHVHRKDPTNIQVQIHGGNERAAAHPGADYRPVDFGQGASRLAKGGKGEPAHAGLSKAVGAGVKHHLKGVPTAKARAAMKQRRSGTPSNVTRFPTATPSPTPPRRVAVGEAAAAFLEVRGVVEAYAPKREPAERHQDFEAFKQKMLGRYHGREHKSGRSTRAALRFYTGQGERSTHTSARMKAQDEPARGSTRARATADAHASLGDEPTRGVRQGLSKDAPGKTARERSKAPRPKSTTQPTGEIGWRRFKPDAPASPSASEIKKRAEDPAAAAAAAAAAKAAQVRMKVLGRKAAAPKVESRAVLAFEGTLGARRAERVAKAVGKEVTASKLADLKQRINPFRASADWGQDPEHPMNQRAKASGAQASAAVLRKSERGGSAERRAVERDRAQAAHHRSDHEGGQRDLGYANRIHVHNRWQGKPGDRGPFDSPPREAQIVADKNRAIARLKEMPGRSTGGISDRIAAAKKSLLAKRAARQQ